MSDTSRSRPLRLGIDLDGVVADFNAGWISRYNGEFGAELLPEHVDIRGAPTLLRCSPEVVPRRSDRTGADASLETLEDMGGFLTRRRAPTT